MAIVSSMVKSPVAIWRLLEFLLILLWNFLIIAFFNRLLTLFLVLTGDHYFGAWKDSWLVEGDSDIIWGGHLVGFIFAIILNIDF